MTTTKAATKRAERERRRANGEVRCEVYVSADDHAWLKQTAAYNKDSVADIVRWCVFEARVNELT